MATDERRPRSAGEGAPRRPQGSAEDRNRRPQRSSEGAPRRPQGSSEGAPRRRPQEGPEGAPRRRPQEGPEGTPRRRPQEGQEGAPRRPQGTSDGAQRRPRPSEDEVRRTSSGKKASDAKKKSSGEQHSKKQASSKANGKKKGGVGKIVLFAVEIVVLIVMVGVLWTVLKTEKVGKVEIAEEDIVINQEVLQKIETTSNAAGNGEGQEGTSDGKRMYSGYRNVALFGVDSREGALTKNTRSDTIIVASINENTGDVKLVSVYRDTYLNLSNDSYNKCNAAYAKGGPTQAINMLNMNLDLDITDFVTIGFDGLIDVIDALGGVEINVLDSEIVHLNNYQISMVGTSKDGETFTANAGTDYIPVKSSGMQTLNGLQATAYCRIRYVGNDFQRAERQRAVIQAIVTKAKANPSKLPAIAESVFSEVYTSLDLKDIIVLLENIAKYQIVDEGGFPEESLRGGANVGSKGSCVIPVDLEANVKWLHKFLFGDEDYETSNAVRAYSVKIYEDVKPYM